MSTHAITTQAEPVFSPSFHISFPGILRGEFLKISRLFWFMLGLLVIIFVAGFFLGASQPTIKTNLQHTPVHFLYYSLG